MSEEELVRVYRPVVFRFSMRLAGNAVEAEDLTQETLLKALAGLKSFEGRSTVASWLYRITLNAWTNRLRARAARREDGLSASTGEEAPIASGLFASGEPTPEALALDAERRGDLARALSRLSDDERRVLEMRELDGLDYAEISRVLGVPLGTVKSRLSRARRIMRTVAPGLAWVAVGLFTLLLSGMLMKRAMPGLFAQIQGMISGAACTMGGGDQ